MVTPAARFKNILLLYPESPRNTYWSFSYALDLIGRKANTPPLGLLTVAAMLPAGRFEARLADINVRSLADADIAWADIVFVSSMIAQKDSLEREVARIKAQGKVIVAGGPYTSTAYGDIAGIDCFVIGEAEAVWDEFLADLTAGTLRRAYAAPVRREEADALRAYFGAEAHIVPASHYPALDATPTPRYDLLDMQAYALMPVQASRGCPVGCEFCDIWRRYGRRTRNKPSSRILAELDEIHRLGWRDTVFLVDDNFIGDRSRAKELLSNLAAWQRRRGWPFALLTEATLSVADDDELLDLMEEAGFNSLFVGIETPATESLRETRKFINTAGSMKDKVARIQARGIQLMSGFIIGFDADPDDIAARMSACIQEMGIPQAMIGLLNALPNTDLHDRLDAESRVRFPTTGNNTHGFALNFTPARPEGMVLADYKKVLDDAYPVDMKSYFQRCAVLRRRWPSRTRRLGDLPFLWKAKAFAAYLGAALTSSYRFQAARFLLTTLMTKPSFFAEAISLAIKGHHLWTITREAFDVEDMRVYMLERLNRLVGFLREKRTRVERENSRIREFAEAALREIEAYSQRMRDDMREKYRRLPQKARAILAREFDFSLAEADRLCACWKLEIAGIPG